LEVIPIIIGYFSVVGKLKAVLNKAMLNKAINNKAIEG
jgi:hypothetical protein